MPCLLVILAFFAPRVVLALLLLFSHFLESAYLTWLWPMLGFFFMPLTTLAYAVSINWHGSVGGGYFFLTAVAFMSDLGVLGGGVRTRAIMRHL